MMEKIGNPDGHKEYQKEISPCQNALENGQLFLYGARTLPSHQPVGMPGSNGILQHPHKNTNQHKNGRKGCRFSEIYGRGRAVSVYVRGEYIKTNTGSEGCRSAVFREGFNKDQQGAYRIIAGKKRGQNAAEAVKEISSENLSCLIQA